MAKAPIILVLRGAHDRPVPRLAYYQALGLKKVGYTLEVVLLCEPTREVAFDFEGAGMPVTYLPERPVAVDWRLLGQLRRHFQQRRPVVVHSHGYKVNFYAIVAARLAGVPHTIATVHEAGVMPAKSCWGLPRTWLYRLHEQVVNRLSEHISPISESVKAAILARHAANPAKITIVDNGIDLARFDQMDLPQQTLREELGLPAEAQIVGNVGRLTAGKNHRCLLRAACRIIEEMPRTHFVIAGVGDLQEELEQLAAKWQIVDNVHFLGFRKDIPQLLDQFDIFAFPTFAEGLSLAVLESMGARLPVVATRAPGLADAVVDTETGYLVPLDDDQTLAQRVVELLRDEQLRARMGEAGRRRVETVFSREVMVQNMIELYRRIVPSPA